MNKNEYKNNELQGIKLKILSITNFRNCGKIDFEFHDNINVLTGLNGAGKTTLLDTIFYLTNGKSYFSSLDKFLYKDKEEYFRLSGILMVDKDQFGVEISSSSLKGKKINLDAKQMKSISAFYGKFPCFMIAPKDIQILVESSIERRRLMDKTLSQVDRTYLKHLLEYNKGLKQRNAALKSFLKSGKQDIILINALNEKMSEPANYIFKNRQIFIKKIIPIFNKYYSELSGDKEKLTLSYKSNLNDHAFVELQNMSLSKDLVLAKTSEGIHRDDLILKINGFEMKKYASQGQLKSAIISLKLAQIEWVRSMTGKIPILLLDDIFDKLDSMRVKNLIDICVNRLSTQVFISDTDTDRVDNILKKLNKDYNHYYIKDGKPEN